MAHSPSPHWSDEPDEDAESGRRGEAFFWVFVVVALIVGVGAVLTFDEDSTEATFAAGADELVVAADVTPIPLPTVEATPHPHRSRGDRAGPLLGGCRHPGRGRARAGGGGRAGHRGR